MLWPNHQPGEVPSNGALGQQLSALAQDVAVLKREYTNLHSHLGSLDTKIDAIANLLAERNKTNWPVFLTVVGLFLGVASAGYKIIDGQTKLIVSETIGPIVAQNATSMVDREDIRQSVSSNGGKISDLAGKLSYLEATTRQQLVEQETQFRAVGDIINMIQARQLSEIARLWRKVFDEDYPVVIHAPRVGRDLNGGH